MILSGGVSGDGDVHQTARLGEGRIVAAITGKAVYEGRLDLASLVAGDVTVANSGQITTSDSGILDNFFGSFTYDFNGNLSGGVMTRLSETYLGQTVFDITGTSVPR